MSSILTNNSAMVALQTLKSVNMNLAKTQTEISTGKTIASAKDNSALWAISKVMDADIRGFQAISDSLALGESTVSVAQDASETVADLLTEIKGKIVASQEENVDRAKIQTDIEALRDQITAVASAAQFNGLNMLSNRGSTAGSGTVNILSSLDRSADGSVGTSNIGVLKQDLGTDATDWTSGSATTAGSGGTISGALDAAAAVAVAGAATPGTTTLVIDSVAVGTGIEIQISGSAGTVGSAFDDTSQSIAYVARDGDTQQDVAEALAEDFNLRVAEAIDAGTLSADTSLAAAVTVAAGGAATLTITGETGTGNDVDFQALERTGMTIGGALEDLAGIDVSTDAGAFSALGRIEGLIQHATDSAAAFGSALGRIETQTDFVSKLMDSLRSGIGSLVDADMEAASARLQALQVQQQLSVQSLSIANQAPQALLTLFR